MYKLKPNVADFEVVDGAFAGRKYEAGKIYHIVPPEEAYKFTLTEDSPPGRGVGVGSTEDNNQ